MRVLPTGLPGVMVIETDHHRDARGCFVRTFDAALGRDHGLVLGPEAQDSLSRSEPGVLRGMHGRRGRGEAKLVRCVAGAVLDVVVDARPGPTRGRHLAIELDDATDRALWIPAGCLHGFQVLRGPAVVTYRIDRPHDPAEDVGVRFDDPDLALPWRGEPTLVSERDRGLGSWRELLAQIDDDH